VTVRYLDAREVAFRGATKRAIESALAGNWKDAAEANRQAIALAPGDVEAHNRLGKALAELGHVAQAIKTYGATTRLDPQNTIAKRNLERLSRVAASIPKTPRRRAAKAGHRGAANGRPGSSGAAANTRSSKKAGSGAFLMDRGRSIVTRLHSPAAASVLATVVPGDLLTLEPEEDAVVITVPDGEHLGVLDPRLGARLARLISGGNRYEAVVASSSADAVSVLIREVYRAPALARQASFPESSASADSYDQDALDANEVLEDESDHPRRMAADEEQEPFSEAARAERLNALIARSPAARGGDSLAV